MRRFLIGLSSFLALSIRVFASDSECLGRSWTPLKSNNKIHIIAPGYGAHDGSVEKACDNIRKYDFLPDVPQDMIDPHPLGYSNTTQYRADHLTRLMKDEEVKVIWAIRGGRGSSLLLPYLKSLSPEIPPKLIVGFSDMTALHLWAAARDYPSLHAIVLGYNQEANPAVNSESSIKEVMSILSGEVTQLAYKFEPLNNAAKQDLSLKTTVVGGNLSLIQRSIGTETQLNAKGKVVLLEDTGEQATRLMEGLKHLERSGLFESVKGVIWGNFSPAQEEVAKYQFIRDEFSEKMDALGIPVIHSLDFGHGPRNNPLPFNTSAILNLGADEVLLKVKTNN